MNAIITWADPTIDLVGSAFDVTGTTVFYFGESGVLSFRSGRNPAFNNISQATQWIGYQVAAGGEISLPDSTLGFGNAPEGGQSTPTYDTTILAIGQGESAAAQGINLSAFAGDVLRFASVANIQNTPLSMQLYVDSVSPANQVALVVFDAAYNGTRFAYTVKAGNHSSIATDTVFDGSSQMFANGNIVLAQNYQTNGGDQYIAST